MFALEKTKLGQRLGWRTMGPSGIPTTTGYGITTPKLFFAYARESSALFWNHKCFEVIPSSKRFGWFRFILVTTKTIVCSSKIYSPRNALFWLSYNIRIQKGKLKAKQAFLNVYSKGHLEIDRWYNSIGTKSPVATPQHEQSRS